MGDGGRGEGQAEEGSKRNGNKKSKLLCFAQDIQRFLGTFCKKTLPTYCDGNAGISLLLDKLFHNRKSLPMIFFFSTVLPLRIPCSCRGRCTSLGVPFTREFQMVHLELHICTITLATLRRAEALCSPVIFLL